MKSDFLTRREVSVRIVSLLSAIGLAGKAGAVARALPFSSAEEISRTCECIHQEVVIGASRARVYQALTDAKQFGKVVDHSFPGTGPGVAGEGLGPRGFLHRQIPVERRRHRDETGVRSHRIPDGQRRSSCSGVEVALLGGVAEGLSLTSRLVRRRRGSGCCPDYR